MLFFVVVLGWATPIVQTVFFLVIFFCSRYKSSRTFDPWNSKSPLRDRDHVLTSTSSFVLYLLKSDVCTGICVAGRKKSVLTPRTEPTTTGVSFDLRMFLCLVGFCFTKRL